MSDGPESHPVLKRPKSEDGANISTGHCGCSAHRKAICRYEFFWLVAVKAQLAFYGVSVGQVIHHRHSNNHPP